MEEIKMTKFLEECGRQWRSKQDSRNKRKILKRMKKVEGKKRKKI